MPIPPPNFSSEQLDKRVSEYLRRLSENNNRLENEIQQLHKEKSSQLSQSSTAVEVKQILSNPLQVLGQFPQGQIVYAPVLSTLPEPGDPLYQNGAVIFVKAGSIYVQWTYEAPSEPGTWVIAPTIPTLPSTILPCCRAFNSANLVIPNNALTLLTYNSERYDTDTIHDNATNPGRLTCTTAGKYVVTLNIAFAANAVGFRGGVITFNPGGGGAAIDIAGISYPAVAAAGERTLLSLPTEYNMATGDYFTSFAIQTSGGNLNVETQGNYSPEFSIALVST